MALEIRQFPCLSDNYGYLIRDCESQAVAAIDAPDASAINAALAREGWRLTHILNTHWHPDHAGANLALKERWRCRIVGPRGEAEKIPGIDETVGENDTISLGGSCARVIETPGHTAGHIVYHFEADGAAFVGDTIFALGCGRLFEGTPAEMWSSLSKIAALPPETKLYCAHEYTAANARFAVTVEPGNAALVRRVKEVAAKRSKNEWTVPSTVAEELATNPFLRAREKSVAAGVGLNDGDPVSVFAAVRKRKDEFR